MVGSRTEAAVPPAIDHPPILATSRLISRTQLGTDLSIRAPCDDECAEDCVFEGSCTVKPNNPGTGRQVGLFSGIATGPERTSTPGRTVNGGEYALLGTDVSDHRDYRRGSGLRRHCVRRSRNRKDTVLYLPGRLRDNADNRLDGQKESAYLALSQT